MKPGELVATGTLFLRARVYSARTSAGAMQLLLPLIERRDDGMQPILGIWTGPEAEDFWVKHSHTLKAGSALCITFNRLSCHSNQLHGHVHSATLAPDRWQHRRAAAPGGEQPSTDQANPHQQQQHA